MSTRKFSRNKGFSLTEVIVALGISVILLLVGAGLVKTVVSEKMSTDSFESLKEVRFNLQGYVNNITAMKNSIENNVSMACLRNRTNCDPATPLEFDIFDSSPNSAATQPVALFKQIPATNGFDVKGVNCNNYPSAECPFRYEVTWAPQCGTDAARCRSPNYTVRGALQVASAYSGPPINKRTFSFEISKDAEGELALTLCSSVGGTFDASTKNCKMAINEQCGAGSFFIGINPDNTKNCYRIPANIKCPLGTTVWKVDAAGNFYCRSGCYVNGLDCKINMWSGVGDCPNSITWDPGHGIVSSSPIPGVTLSPAASYYAPPPAPVPPAPPAPIPAPEPVPDPSPDRTDMGT